MTEARAEQAAPRGRVVEDPGDGPMYVPAPGELQLTARALLIGCSLGGLVAAMNIRFGLKTGWSIAGSLLSAILAFAVFKVLASKDRPFTALETNIAQTAGSAAGSMTSAAGLLSAVPAMGMLGYELSYLELTVWAAAIGWLGIFYAVPLRRQMVLVDKLRFPTGTATAATIAAMFSSGDDALRKARTLVAFGVFAGLYMLSAQWVPELEMPPFHTWLGIGALVWMAGYGVQLLVSPLMLGAGILIGWRTAASLFLGALIAWLGLAPYVEAQGWVADPTATMSYTDGARGWILWPGVALMVSDALTNLALAGPTILRTFTGGSGDDEDGPLADLSPEERIPNAWWIGGLGFSTMLTVAATWWMFDIPPWMSVLAVALSSVLAAIAVRSTGETDINPIGGMGKVTQLVYGGLAPGSIPTNLMTAAISSAGASQAGDMMHDLKTGHLLGASPRKQMMAQMIGVGVGVLVCVPIYKIFDRNFEIGGAEYPAPAAFAWKGMAEVLTKGLDALPENALYAVAAAAVVGVVVPLLRKLTGWTWLPSTLAAGIAFIVPAYYAIGMFLGALLLQVWRRADPKGAEALAFAVASGLIVGDGLVGVAIPVVSEVGKLLGFG